LHLLIYQHSSTSQQLQCGAGDERLIVSELTGNHQKYKQHDGAINRG
jgi:hypothetical protein